MDLWIRSQDKEKLLKVNDIAIEMNMIYGYFDKNTEYEHLGSYASRERALEVLDEIQNILKPIIITTGYECECKDNLINKMSFDIEMIPTKTEIKEMTTYVYEMPKE